MLLRHLHYLDINQSHRSAMHQEQSKTKTETSQKIIFAGEVSRATSERCRIIFKYLQFKCDQQVYSDSEQSLAKWQKQIRPHVFDFEHARPFFPYLIIESMNNKRQRRQLICTNEGIITYAIVKSNRQQLLGKKMEQRVALETASTYFRKIEQQFDSKIEKNNEGQVSKQQCMEIIKENLKKLSVLLADRQFFCGSITWFDFVIAEFLQGFFGLERQLKKQFKSLEDHQKRIWELAEIKEYVNSEQFKCKIFRSETMKKWE